MTLESIAAIKVLAPGLLFLALFIGERVAAAAPAPLFARRHVANGALWILILIVSPLLALPLAAFATAHPFWERGAALAGAPAMLVDFVILDCWAYLAHRAWHTVPILWRVHRAHHFDEHLDTTSAGRFHPLEVVLSAALRMPVIMLFAIPLLHVVLFDAALLAASIFHHSNLKLPARLERALSRVIVTPSIHWVHHHAVRRDTNANYSAILSLWDRAFGTASPTKRAAGMKIGVEGLFDRPILALLIAPFSRMK